MSIEKRCLAAVKAYADAEAAARHEIGLALTDDQMLVQAERATELVIRLKNGHTAVLDDPVGTGKTIVALASAKELLRTKTVDRVLIVCPNGPTAVRWAERARRTGLDVDRARLRTGSVTVCSKSSLDALKPRRRAQLLVIIDEAHRGLHNHQNPGYKRLQAVIAGARVMLVSATPFQLSANGLAAMLAVGEDPNKHLHEPLRVRAEKAAKLVAVLHEKAMADSPGQEVKEQEQAALAEYLAADHEARQRIHNRIFLPTYPRERMGLPDQFKVPAATPVEPSAAWMRAYYVARLIPDLVPVGSASERVQNSDAFMRELVSSTSALRASKAWARFVEHAHDTATGRRLRKQLEVALFSGAHPKVEETAKVATRRSREGRNGRHVLIFCYFRATPEDIKRAITAIDPGLRVVVAADEARARRAHQQEGFGLRTSTDNPPMILIVGERLSESVDLDGGRPIIIHHDLSWSPIRFDQRMGRVVRASSGFQMVAPKDVVIPVLTGGIDQRMYDTLKGRRLLAHTALGGVDDPHTLGV